MRNIGQVQMRPIPKGMADTLKIIDMRMYRPSTLHQTIWTAFLDFSMACQGDSPSRTISGIVMT